MEKLVGLRKIKTAVFISGNGSNLKSLHNFSLSKKSPIEIRLVLSDNKNAKGLIFSKKNKLKTKVYNFKKDNEYQIVQYLNKNNIDLICLAGFMKILSANFIKKFSGTILNIHPSLLPKYKGLNTHQRVINNNEKFSGCTVHLVTSKLDSGKIILQKKVKIFKKDDYLSLSKRILKQEHTLYPQAIIKLFSNL
jgi:phosphoribosylglycinamide formyltransferase-1